MMTQGSSRDKTKKLQQENEGLRKKLKGLTIRYEKEKETSYKTKQLLKNTIKATLNAMFFIDAKTEKIIDCSPSASEMFGFRRDEMIGNRVDLLHVDVPHQEAFRAQLQVGVAQNGFLFLPGFELKRKNGVIFPTEHSVFPIRDRQGKISDFVGLIRDLTGIRWAENALKESKDNYQTLVETMTDGLGITDENRRIIYANDKAVDMLGYSLTELLGCSPLEFLDKANQKIMNDQQKEIGGAGRGSYELTWTRKDGQKIHTIMSPRDIFAENGTYKGTFSVITDITSRKQLEHSLSKQAKELQLKSQNLEELNTALKVLLRKREEDSLVQQEKVLANMNQLVAPTMEKIKQTQLNKNQQVLIDILESNLAEIVSSFSKSLSTTYLLTATELQIANLLKQGKTSKEMAKILHLSLKTIHTHRRNIRKKLGLSGKKENLRAYLLNFK
jgi:PAS domain S-box-containing protein